MAKGPLVTDEVEALIGATYQKHPKWKAPEVRNEVSYILRKRNPKLPAGWPSLSSVQKVLATIRRKSKEIPDNPEDKPWSTAKLDQYPLPPEAIPAVVKAWKAHIDKGTDFTIRQAKWVARFSACQLPAAQAQIAEQVPKVKEGDSLLDGVREELMSRAREELADLYSRLEILYELIDRHFDSTVLDKVHLMGLSVEIEDWGPTFWASVSQAGLWKNDPINKTIKSRLERKKGSEAHYERPHKKEGQG